MARELPSPREILTSQGVTSPESLRGHVDFIEKTLSANPRFDFRSYRVNPLDTNRPYMG